MLKRKKSQEQQTVSKPKTELLRKTTIKELIAPSGIDASSLDHLEIISNVKKYARSFLITNLPRMCTFPEFLRGMYTFGDLNVSVFINPISEATSQTDLNSVIKLKDEMQQAFGKYFKIDIIHGKMATASKDMIMNKFKNNEIQILISTTVVEVGVDVQNATCMVIFDADRFGLSTLHQLRGRVGRGEDKSLCILVSSSDTERLKIMEKVSDGFLISEEDFKLRGHGDLFGTKQSGDMIFKIANVRIDYKILLQAKKDSEEYLLNKEYDNDGLKEKIISSIDKA